jgi:hypothetical protein
VSDEVLRPNSQVVLTEMRDGSAVLLHLETRFYFTLNATGVFIWKLLSSERAWDRHSLALELTREFDVDLPTASSDVGALLDLLRTEELLTPTRG